MVPKSPILEKYQPCFLSDFCLHSLGYEFQNANESQEKKKGKGFGLSSMHFTQNYVLKNHNCWPFLLLGKTPKQLTAAYMKAAGSRANVPSTAQGSWILLGPATPLSNTRDKHPQE